MNGHRIDVLAQMLGAIREEDSRRMDDDMERKVPLPSSRRHTYYLGADAIETAIMELPAQSTRNAMVKATIAALWSREMHEADYQEDEVHRRHQLIWSALKDVAVFLGAQSGIAIDQLGLGSWYDLGSGEDTETASVTARPARPDADLETAWAEYHRIWTAINESGEDVSEDDCNRQDVQVDYVVRTPAVSAAGVAVRLRLLKDHLRSGKWIHQDTLLDSVLADLDRLAKGGGA